MTGWFEFVVVSVILLTLIQLVVVATWMWRARMDRAEWERRTRAELVRNVVTDKRLVHMHVIESDVGQVIRTIPIGQIRQQRGEL